MKRGAPKKKLAKIDALALCALAIDARIKEGTPTHEEALQLLDDARQLWREQFIKKCPKCGHVLQD